MSRMQHLLRRYVVYPIHDWKSGRRIVPLYKEARRAARLGLEERDALSWSRLKAILEECERSVPYYRELFASRGIAAADFRTWEDLGKLPPLTKKAILSAGDRLFNGEISRNSFHLRRTGGSTGPAMQIYYDTPGLDASSAIDRRSLEWAGYKLGERIVHIVNRDPLQTPEQAKQEKLKLWAVNFKKILVDRLDDDKLDRLFDELDAVRAKWVNAYPSLLFVLAQRAAATGRRLKRNWGAFTTGETLFESQRRSVRENLGIEIFNRYGSAEFGVIAQECRSHSGLHINTDHVHVDLEPVSGEKDVYEIFVTTLTNRAMPLVRYKTEDLCIGGLATEPCSCGLDFPRLVRVEGRVHDVLYTPGGGRLLSSFLQDTLLPFGGVRQFQLVQRDFDHLEFRYLPDTKMNGMVLERIRKHIASYLGHEMRVDFVQVPSLPTSREGKLRYTQQAPEFREKLKAAASA